MKDDERKVTDAAKEKAEEVLDKDEVMKKVDSILDEAREEAGDKAEDVKDKAEEVKEAAEDKVEDAKEAVEEKVEDAKDAVEDKKDKKEKKAKKDKKEKKSKKSKEGAKKQSAADAREKRKASIEEATRKQAEKDKKRAEKKAKETPAQRRAKILVPIAIVCVAIACFFLWFFGVPNRHITAVKAADGSKISVAEYEYYYRSLYNYYYNMSSQYETYYSAYYGTGAGQMMTGFDASATPEEQEFQSPAGQTLTVDESYGENPTWADYFEQNAIETSQDYTVYYNKAIEAGYEMTDEETTEMNDFIEQLRDTATENDYSLDAYLRVSYGRGMTEELLKEIYEKQTIAADYLEDQQEKISDGITEDEINTEYEKNAKDYTTVSVRYFAFTPDITADDDTTDKEIEESNKQVRANAETMLEEVTADNFTDIAYNYAPDDYKSYYKDDDTYTTMSDTTYDSMSSSVSEDAAEWAWADDTAVGDKKIFETKADTGLVSCYVVMLSEKPTRDESHPVSVRQILFQVEDEDTDSEEDTDEEEEEETGHTDEEAKKLAEDALQEWKNGDATDESFAALATELTEDTGSAEDGGLYEDITPSSSYVQEFLDWCFEDGRKVGDTGIIKTDYGYHVMYMKEIAEEPVWMSNIRSALTTNKVEEWEESLTKDNTLDDVSNFWIKRVRKRVERYAEQTIASASSSSDSDYYYSE